MGFVVGRGTTASAPLRGRSATAAAAEEREPHAALGVDAEAVREARGGIDPRERAPRAERAVVVVAVERCSVLSTWYIAAPSGDQPIPFESVSPRGTGVRTPPGSSR